MPAGLSLEEASLTEAWVLGTPATPGISTFTVRVTDDARNTARQSFTITIGTGKLDNIVVTQAATTLRSTSCSSPRTTPTPT